MRAKLLKGALYVLGALILLVALALWIIGREITLRYAFEHLAARSQGMLSVQGLRGGLYEGMSFDTLVIKLPTQTITLEDGSILWEAMAFTGKTLLSRHARVARVTVETTRASTEPAREPADLLLPIDLIIPSLEIGEIELRNAAGKQPTVTKLAPLRLALQHRSRQWQVDSLSLVTPWGEIAGQFQLGAVKPFPVAGKVAIDQKTGDIVYRADIRLEGRLPDLRISSSFVAKGMPGGATARLAPFSDQPLVSATVDVPRFLPKQWNTGWPEADLAVRAALAPDGKTRWRGDARVVNNLPGSIDNGRIPVASATSRFSGNLQAMRLDDVAIALSGGGSLTGSGQIQDAKPTFALTARDVNLNGLHKKLRATRIGGDIGITQRGEAMQVAVALSEANLALKGNAEIDNKTVLVSKAELRAGKGSVTFSGNAGLQGNRPFTLAGEAASFNPAEFGDYPAGSLSAVIKAEGTLSPSWRVSADATLKPSQLAGKPLSGTLKGTATPDSVSNVDANILFATNRITARGGMSGGKNAGSDKLAWEADLKRLADFNEQLGGQVLAKGEISGTFSAPRGEFTMEASELRYQEAHRVRSLVAKGSVANAASLDAARVELQATLAGYRASGFRLDRASLQLTGTRGAHTAKLTAANRQVDAAFEARGGLSARNEWKGEVTRFESKGDISIASRTAFTLAAGPNGVEVGNATIDVNNGRVENELLRVDANGVAAKGRAQNVPLSIAGLFSDEFRRQVGTTLRLSGDWNLALGPTASGTLRIARESGDVEFRTDPQLPLGLDQLDFSATINENRVNAKLDAKGSRLGIVHAAATTRLSKRGRAWGIAGNAPLEGAAELDVPSLDWASRFTGQSDLQLNGRLRANLTAAGTLAKPRLTGTAQGEALTLTWPAQGVKVRDGVLEARFNDNSVTVQRFRVSGGEGTAEADGTLQFGEGRTGGRINLTLKEFEAVSRPDRMVVASGTGSVEFDDKRLTIKASLKADRGLIDLPEKSGPTVSDDIVVTGGRRPTAPETAERKMLTRFDLRLDLGERFRIKGGGIDGELEGVLNVTSTDGGLPRALGTLRVVDGTYLVYGQKLSIERGIITFSGPMDNPGLNILALRKGLQVEAGVEVRGSAIAPQAKLVSTPNVPETDKLSWLILGRGIDASTQGDFSLLSAAASGLLSSERSASVQARLANALGVDEFGVSAPSGGQGGLLTVGKRLSSRLYLTYEQGLGHVSNLLKIRYVLSKRWSVQAQTGTDNAADVFYTFSFD
jgi:translocation and assembly module TamB